MSHQLAVKKGSFEIPPLNWKAPDADQKTDRAAAPAEAAASKKTETSGAKA